MPAHFCTLSWTPSPQECSSAFGSLFSCKNLSNLPLWLLRYHLPSTVGSPQLEFSSPIFMCCTKWCTTFDLAHRGLSAPGSVSCFSWSEQNRTCEMIYNHLLNEWMFWNVLLPWVPLIRVRVPGSRGSHVKLWNKALILMVPTMKIVAIKGMESKIL